MLFEGVALPMLQSSSTWSRALDSIEVGENSAEDALKYLESWGVGHDDALDAVKRITGGRFSLLTDKVNKRKSNEEWLMELERRHWGPTQNQRHPDLAHKLSNIP